jgi:hypothetical protein
VPTRTEIVVAGMILFGTSLALLALVALLAWWQRWRERPRRSHLRAARQEAAGHAAAITERAVAAATTAQRARQRAEAVERERERAFEEMARVQRDHDRIAEEYHRMSQQWTQQVGDGSGRRELTHAAFAAYRRGDLSQEELWRVWRIGSGWAPELDRLEQQLLRSRAARRDAQVRYRAATNRARQAAQQADLAEEQARALIEEAADAAGGVDVTA